jgi:hypothetical protein
MANTPLRSFRISDELYKAAQKQAQKDEMTLTEVLLSLLRLYVGNSDESR